MKVVFTSQNEEEAKKTQAMLEQNLIESTIQSSGDGWEIVVSDEDWGSAKVLLP